MADKDHGTILPTNGPSSNRGNHVIQGLADFANEAAREAFTVLAADVGMVARQTDTNKWYIAITAGTGASSWQQIGSGGASGGSIVLGWNWLTDIVDNDPGSGNMKGNNATQGSITQLNINDITSNGKNVTVVLESIHPDDVLIVTETSDSTRFIIFEANGIAVDQTTYWEVPGVVSQASASPIRNNRECAVQILFASMSPLTTKGDLFTYDTADARLPVGANGFSPVADTTEALGLTYLPAGTTSGVLTGMEVTINGGDPALFDVAAGTGVIWDWTGGTVTATFVTFAGVTGVTVTDIATTTFTSLFINTSAAVEQFQDVNPTATQRRELISIQILAHAGTTITSVSGGSQPAYDVGQAAIDYIRALGPVNAGNLYGAAAANLTVAKSAGVTTLPFINRSVDTQNPSESSNPTSSPAAIRYSFRDGAGGFTFAVSTVTDVDVANFDDDSGTPATVSPGSRFTIQRGYFFGQTDATVFTYGQVLYNSIVEAEAAIFTENPEVDPQLDGATFTTAIIVRANTTDLSDTADAKFVTVNIGAVSAGGTGAVTSVATTSSASLITISPTTTDVVVVINNQEIDTTGDNTFYGENTGNEGSRNVLATVNTGVGSGSFLVLDEGVGNGSWGADNFPLLTNGNANQGFGRNTGLVVVDGDNNLFFGNNLSAPASNTSNYITIDDTLFMNSDSGGVRVGGLGVVAGQSIFQVVNDATNDTSSVIFVENSSATNGADVQMRFGDRDPVAFSAIDGSIYFRADDGNSTIYVNTSTTSGTTWADLSEPGPTSGAAGIIQTSDGADGFTSGNLVVIDESSISLRDPFTTASSSSGTLALDFSVDQFIEVTLTENITTINLTMPSGPSLKRLRIIQDPVTARSMTGWAIAGGAVRWQGGVEFVPTSIVDAIDKVVLDFDATNIDATYGLDFS